MVEMFLYSFKLLNKAVFILLFFITGFESLSQNADSLHNVWNDNNRHDTIRLEAASMLVRKFLFSDPPKAFAIAEEMFGFSKKTKYLSWQASSLALMGVACEVKGDFQKAGNYYNEWKNILEKTGERPKLAMAYNNIGNIYWKQGDLLTALDFYQKSLSIRLSLNDKTGMASSYNNIGLIFSNQKEHEKALDYYKKAEKIFEEINDKNNLISTYGNIGLSLMKLKRHDEAMVYFQKSLKEAEEKKNKPGIAAAYNSIGTILTDKKEFDKAVEYFEKAIEINTSLGNFKSLASSYYNFGNLEINRSNYEKAKELCKTGYDHAIKAKVLAEKMNNCECLYLAEKKSGRFNEALEYYELFSSYRDSIASEDRRKEVTRKEVRFEYEKKRTADSILFRAQKMTLQAEVEKQKAFAELEHLLSEKKSTQIDSLNKENYIRNLEIKNKESELLTAQKEKKLRETEINLKNQKLEQEKWQRYFLFAGLIMVVIFAVFIFNRFRITRKQRNVIAIQKKEVEHQKELIQEKNTEILDSILYAKHLQNAILPPIKLWNEYLPDSFVLYKPKDIVAGDFYFFEKIENRILFAAADCTGHGVPGAMVSVVCSNALNRAVREFALTDPGKILDKVKELVLATFERSEHDVNDGMDISLVSLTLRAENKNGQQISSFPHPAFPLQWSGANNPLWIVRKGQGDMEQVKSDERSVMNDEKINDSSLIIHRPSLIEFKPDKQPIGKSFDSEAFTTHHIELEKGDTLYVFTDGYQDQFGGEKGKKFNVSRLKELILAIQHYSMQEQHQLLIDNFNNWRGDIEQIDDVCVIGVRI